MFKNRIWKTNGWLTLQCRLTGHDLWPTDFRIDICILIYIYIYIWWKTTFAGRLSWIVSVSQEVEAGEAGWAEGCRKPWVCSSAYNGCREMHRGQWRLLRLPFAQRTSCLLYIILRAMMVYDWLRMASLLDRCKVLWYISIFTFWNFSHFVVSPFAISMCIDAYHMYIYIYTYTDIYIYIIIYIYVYTHDIHIE